MKKIIIISLLLISIVSSAFSSDALTIEESYAEAKANNKSYSLALLEYKNFVNEENKENPFLPSISLSSSISTQARMINEQSIQSPSFSLSAGASFSLSATSFIDKEVKNANNNEALLSLTSTEETLKSSVVEAYLNLLLYREAVKVSEESYEKASSEYTSILSSYNEGLSSELELKQSELALKEAETKHKENKRELESKERAFYLLTGIDSSKVNLISLDSFTTLSLIDAETLFENYKEDTTLVKSAKNSLLTKALEEKSGKLSAYAPSFSLSANYSLGYSESSNLSDSLSLSATVSIPIDGYIKNSAYNIKVKKAENDIEESKLSLSITYETLLNDIKEVLSSLSAIKESIELQESKNENLQYQETLTKEMYESGSASYQSLVESHAALLEGKYSLLSYKVNYISKLYTLSTLLSVEVEDLLIINN